MIKEDVKIKYLKALAKVKNCIFVKVENGKVTDLNDVVEVNESNVIYGRIPDDGIYRLSPQTCGNEACDILKPNPKCVEGGVYSEKKCAKYAFEPVGGTVFMSYDQLYELLEGFDV